MGGSRATGWLTATTRRCDRTKRLVPVGETYGQCLDVTTKGPPPSLSIEIYREVIGDLRRLWDDFKGAETRARDAPKARFVFAFTANSYNAARAAVALWDLGYWHDSLPNVRACFESAMFAAWIQQTGDASIVATDHEQTRQAENLMRAVENAGIEVPAELRSAIVGQMRPKPPSAHEARSFEVLCDRLVGGKDLYLFYRQLSGESHASGALGRYLVPAQGGGLIQVKNPDEASAGRKAMIGCVVAYSLTWAGRALSEVLIDRPHKQPLRKVAHRLGIPPILTKR